MHSAEGFLLSLLVFVSVATPGRDCATTLLLKDGHNSMTKQAYRDRDNEENIPLGLRLYIMAKFHFFSLGTAAFSVCRLLQACETKVKHYRVL